MPMYRKGTWGDWYCRGGDLLQHAPTAYWIDLKKMKSADAILAWIVQVSEKTWADDTCIANLVRALNGILDMRVNFCGEGAKHKNVGNTATRENGNEESHACYGVHALR